MNTLLYLALLTMSAMVDRGEGHGRLMKPIGRSSAWRKNWNTPKNYDDNALSCGGRATQTINGGKCGVCGDSYSGTRENEAGGKYAKGIIVETYKIRPGLASPAVMFCVPWSNKLGNRNRCVIVQVGQTIMISTQITANHYGWMEYRICPNNDVKKAIKQECLDKYLLQRADGKGARVEINTRRTGMWDMEYKLPDRLTCSQCVIQWKYHAGNSWGRDEITGRGCVGCGPQEEFYACADVAIIGNRIQVTPKPTLPPPTQKLTPSHVVITQPPFIAGRVQTTKAPAQQTTPRVFIGVMQPCKATHNWAGDAAMDKWCTVNCAAGKCPAYGCDCSGGQSLTEKVTTQRPAPTTTSSTATPTTTTPTTTTTTTTTEKPTTQPDPLVLNHVVCKGVNLWAGNPFLDKWCSDACAQGNCPPSACLCSTVQVMIKQPATTVLLPETSPPNGQQVCKAISLWKGIAVFDVWCTEECSKGNCPSETCQCSHTIQQTIHTEPPTTTSKPGVTSYGKCVANGISVDGDYWNSWCQDSCDRGFCEQSYCRCNA